MDKHCDRHNFTVLFARSTSLLFKSNVMQYHVLEIASNILEELYKHNNFKRSNGVFFNAQQCFKRSFMPKKGKNSF